jgi:phosphonate transport system substrate-binding protein
MRFLLIALIFCSATSMASELRFAPLPMLSEKALRTNYSAFLEYLEQATGIDISWRYVPEYGAILDALASDQLDMAYLGPLPYVELKQKAPHVVPLVRFLEADGASHYFCALIRFGEEGHGDGLSLRKLRIGLTQPESTCGLLAVSVMLKRHGRSPLDTGNSFEYAGGHDKVALGVLEGKYDIGGLKESIADNYRSLDLRVVERAGPYPGFALVVNTRTMSLRQIDHIRQALLSSDYRRHKMGPLFSRAIMPAQDSDYDGFRADWRVVKKILEQRQVH